MMLNAVQQCNIYDFHMNIEWPTVFYSRFRTVNTAKLALGPIKKSEILVGLLNVTLLLILCGVCDLLYVSFKSVN